MAAAVSPTHEGWVQNTAAADGGGAVSPTHEGWVQNTAAADQDQGARVSLGLGDSRRAAGWELTAAYQRIQRDAVLAAFNDDDWWFHGFSRGATVALSYGLSSNWRLRLAWFDERRDGIGERTQRAFVDLRSDW